MQVAVNTLTDHFATNKCMMAKVKVGKAKLAVKTGILCKALQPIKRAITALAFVAVIQFKPFTYYCCLNV